MASFLTSGNYLDIFEDVGEFIEAIDQLRATCTGDASAGLDLTDNLSEINAELAGNGRYDVLSGVQELFDALRDSIIQQCEAGLGSFVTKRLLHRTTVLEKLPVASNAGIQEVLAAIIRDMSDVGTPQTVDRSTVTVGSITDDSAGSGNVVVSKVLDGASSPGAGFAANPEYVGLNSELCVTSETMKLTCIRDADTDGVPSGEEIFRWEGGVKNRSKLDWRTEGSGIGPEVPTLNASQIVLNKDFEVFTTTNQPDNWDRDTGTLGTHIFESSSSPFRGTKYLKLTGDGSLAAIQLSQTILTGLVPLRRYALAVMVKGEASTTNGTLTIQFESPSGGYSAGSSEKVSLDATALSAQTTFDIEYFFINMPAVIPSDMELVIKVTGTLTNAKSVHIDSLAFGPVSWHGGVNLFVYAGSTEYRRGDRFSWTIANDDAGTFQRFFRKFYGVQLPSAAAAAETIDDALAE